MATLTKNVIDSAKKGKRKAAAREGFIDENKQTFLPPSDAKKLSSWKKKMGELGHEFQ